MPKLLNLEFKHDDLPCMISQEHVTDERPYVFVDLGNPADVLKPSQFNVVFTGPRMAARRTDDGKGWRIVLHSGDDDPFYCCHIKDPIGDEEPVVTTEDP